MELAIPLAALTGLYVTSRHNNENKIECENFENIMKTIISMKRRRKTRHS